jgi:hypothetical protein
MTLAFPRCFAAAALLVLAPAACRRVDGQPATPTTSGAAKVERVRGIVRELVKASNLTWDEALTLAGTHVAQPDDRHGPHTGATFAPTDLIEDGRAYRDREDAPVNFLQIDLAKDTQVAFQDIEAILIDLPHRMEVNYGHFGDDSVARASSGSNHMFRVNAGELVVSLESGFAPGEPNQASKAAQTAYAVANGTSRVRLLVRTLTLKREVPPGLDQAPSLRQLRAGRTAIER